MEANAEMRPTVGGPPAAGGPRAAAATTRTWPSDVAARNLRGRILVSLAFAEAERGDVEPACGCSPRPSRYLPRAERGLLHGQRGILLRRTGRDELAAATRTAARSPLSTRTASR